MTKISDTIIIFIDFLVKLNNRLNTIVWGPVMVVFILSVGMYITIGIRFLQIKNLYRVFKETLFRPFKKSSENAAGDITPWQALNVALGGTVGVGNIAGVATAISLGGPGAIFWLWISGLVGMATKFAEVVLGIKFRVREKDGPMVGGPMMYIKNGLPKRLHFLAYIFASFGMIAALGIGNMVQANSVASGAAKFGIPFYYTGIFLVLLVGIVTIGGIKRIAEVATICVPFMCSLYFISAIVVIISHIKFLPSCFVLIVKKAFSSQAAIGGFAGATVFNAIKYGIARGVFSNEAGLGSASIAHSTAITDHPVKQGFWGIIEVFIDTLVICTATGLAIIITGVWTTGKTGADLTMEAFSTILGKNLGFAIVVLSMILTAYSTILAWGFYGETCAAFIFGHKIRFFYRLLWLPFIFLGAIGKLEIV